MVSLEGGRGVVEILKIVRGHKIFWSQHRGHEIFQVTPKGSRDIPGFYKNPSRPGGMYHLCQFPYLGEFMWRYQHKGTDLFSVMVQRISEVEFNSDHWMEN